MDRYGKYTALLMRHRTQMWRMCWLHAHGNRERCCDLLQDASIALWLNMDKLHPDATPAEENAWVRWQVRSMFEHAGRRRQPSVEPLTEAMADTLTNEDTRRVNEDIEEIMSTLNHDEQRMLRLQLEGYRADEIAAIMGLRRDAVYQRLRRAISKARRVLVVLLFLLLTTVAVAVVPQWRKALFGKEETEEIPPTDDVKPTATADTAATETTPVAATPKPASRARMGKMEHLGPIETETDEPFAPIHDIPTIAVDGNRLTVSGVYGERVTVYSSNGSLLASQICNGICTFTILPDSRMLAIGRYGDYVVRIGDSIELIVTQ